MAAIETDDLTRSFGDLTAVSDLSMTVERGEVFGFLGPNGAGKSTTIHLLLGFIEPTSGSARVLGETVRGDTRSVRRRIGLLPEGFEALANLTAREHVRSAIATKGADDDPDEIIERVGLDADDARRPVGEYSTGMRQRTALAIALVGDPDLLILDEPTSGLDPNGVQLVREIVREERERGATVFFSSHILDEVERVCDRVGILRDGELVAVNSVADLREEFGGESVVEARVDRVPDDLALTDIEGVTDVSVEDSTVRISCAMPAAKMPALARLDDAVTVEDVGIQEASLEDVFEKYTDGDVAEPAGPDDSEAGSSDADGPDEDDQNAATATAGGEPR